MQIIDLFSGIGGFSLAGQWMGWRTIQFCEIDKFCQQVLKYYWPNVPIHDDIKTLAVKQIKNNNLYDENETTIIVGGVPCQPWSQAGKRKGRDDNRDLWTETIGFIGKFKPTFVVLENVSGLLSWNGGLVFDEVQADLEAEGYEVQPVLLPAASVGAPHRRDRVWFIAYSNGSKSRDNERTNGRKAKEIRRQDKGNVSAELCSNGDATNTSKERLQGRKLNGALDQEAKEQRKQPSGSTTQRHKITDWQNFPTTKPTIRKRDDGISERLDGITFSKWRNESIKAYGNAIVPNVALQIFKAIEQMENLKNETPKKN